MTTTDSTIRSATADAITSQQRRANTTASTCALEILSRFAGHTLDRETVLTALELAYHTGGRDQLAASMRDFAADLKRDATEVQS